MSVIRDYHQLVSYFETEEKMEELIEHCKPYFNEIERIGQKLRLGELDNNNQYEEYKNIMTGVYQYLNKISKMAYSFAQTREAQALLDYTNNWKNHAPEEAGSTEAKRKYIKYSSTVAAAKAKTQTQLYFHLSTFLNANLQSAQSIILSLQSNSKFHNKPFDKDFDRVDNQEEIELED